MFSKLSTDNLFHKDHARPHPDRLEYCLLRGRGEFSIGYEIGFQRHINRLNNLSHDPIFKSCNGDKLKEITRSEPLWW